MLGVGGLALACLSCTRHSSSLAPFPSPWASPPPRPSEGVVLPAGCDLAAALSAAAGFGYDADKQGIFGTFAAFSELQRPAAAPRSA